MKGDRTNEKRREFLKGALVGTGAAALAAAGATAAAAPVEKQKPDAKPKTASQGYQETDHVRAYYKTAEF